MQHSPPLWLRQDLLAVYPKRLLKDFAAEWLDGNVIEIIVGAVPARPCTSRQWDRQPFTADA